MSVNGGWIGGWSSQAGGGGGGTVGTSILAGNGSGGFTNVTIGAGLDFTDYELTATGSGSNPFNLGDVILATEEPTSGTWLETGKYYSKSTYNLLAPVIGDIPDIGDPVAVPQAQLPQPFAAAGSYCAASSGSVYVAIGSSNAIRKSTDGVTWVGVPSTTGYSLYEVRYLNSNFVAVGDAIVTSTDGEIWTARAIASSGTMYSVAYGNSKYVCVGSGSAGAIQYSTDLITWTVATGTGSLTFSRVTYANNIFVAVGSSGACYSSPDGVTWTSRSAGTNNFNDVIYANSLFVAVGAAGKCYTSPDGITWTSRSAGATQLVNVYYDNSLFVAVGNSGVIYTSSDGLTWTSRTSGTIFNLTSVVWNGTNFISVGSGGRYCTSADGVTWTANIDASVSNFYFVAVLSSKTIAFGSSSSVILAGTTRTEVMQSGTWGFAVSAQSAPNPRSIAYGSSTYVTAGSSGVILTSTDGIEWTGRNSTVVTNFDKVFYVTTNTFIALGGSGSGTNLLTSTDNGVTWTARTAGTAIFNAAAYGASVYVVAGASGAVYSSSDLVTWTSRSAGANTFNDVIFANSVFVAVGASNSVYSSSDGATWTLRTATGTFTRVIYQNSLFVAVGASGVIYTSADGTTWTSRTSNVAGQLNDVVWNGSIFCAVGASGVITTSPDGVTWTARTPGDTSVTLNSISWNGTRFIVTNTTNGAAWTSTDGITWSRVSTVYVGTTIYSGYLNNKFIAVGNSFIQTSADGLTWTNANQVQYVPTSISKLYNLGGFYYALTNKGLFQSSDGVSFSTVRTSPVGTVLSMAYSGSTWLAVSSSGSGQPQAFYKSTDGTTWTKASDFGTLTTTSTLSGAAIDLVYANGNFIAGQPITTAQNLPFTIYTSTDGITWTGRQTPYLNQPTAAMASDGSTAVFSGGVGSYKSTDGGVTWELIAAHTNLFCIYIDGLWALNNYWSLDLVTFQAVATVVQGFYKSGNYVWSTPSQTKLLANIKTFGSCTYGVKAVAWTGPSTYKENPIRSTIMLVAMNRNDATYPNLIAEFPLYSYDTSTTFWIPPNNAGVGQIPYMYAGEGV